ncbi:MAG: hypothetical protein P9X22_07760 [Candidatus Zapsychrus exili]|nr:hypothetical protein [Candidatus Zapsychrus exili]
MRRIEKPFILGIICLVILATSLLLYSVYALPVNLSDTLRVQIDDSDDVRIHKVYKRLVAEKKNLKILLVGDKIHKLNKILEKNGHEVTEAGNCQKALEIVKKSPEFFDLVLSEAAFFAKAGMEYDFGRMEFSSNLLKSIRSDPDLQSVPFLLQSGSIAPDLTITARELNSDVIPEIKNASDADRFLEQVLRFWRKKIAQLEVGVSKKEVSLENRKILIVQDRPIDAKIQKRILLGMDAREENITIAADYNSAKEALANSAFDLILLDMGFPMEAGDGAYTWAGITFMEHMVSKGLIIPIMVYSNKVNKLETLLANISKTQHKELFKIKNNIHEFTTVFIPGADRTVHAKAIHSLLRYNDAKLLELDAFDNRDLFSGS